jgi:triosephosphate isomerase
MSRKPIIAGNWKMYKLTREALATVIALNAPGHECQSLRDRHCNPHITSIKSVADKLEGSNIQLAAQNISGELKQGAHTGEICGDMLYDVGCTHVIVGHSERRQYYGETDGQINRKIRAALQFKLKPIFCVGRDTGRAR